jgi:hypothetical protein
LSYGTAWKGVMRKAIGATQLVESYKKAEKRWCYSLVDSPVVEYSPDSNDMSAKAEEFQLLRAVTKQRLVKTLHFGEDLACCDL